MCILYAFDIDCERVPFLSFNRYLTRSIIIKRFTFILILPLCLRYKINIVQSSLPEMYRFNVDLTRGYTVHY